MAKSYLSGEREVKSDNCYAVIIHCCVYGHVLAASVYDYSGMPEGGFRHSTSSEEKATGDQSPSFADPAFKGGFC